MTLLDGPTTARLRLRPDRTDLIEALLLGAGPHLARVLDIGTTVNGDLLVLLPVPVARLPELLATPGFPTAGEAVTVLAPLAEALQRLHVQGVAHGGVAADAVGFDDDGTPSWAAPVAPSIRRRVGEQAFRSAVARDLADFGTMAALLTGRAGRTLRIASDLAGAIDALFAFAEPQPIRLHPASAEPEVPRMPARLVAIAAVPADTVARRDRQSDAGAVDARPPATRTAIGAGLAAARAGARSVRRRVWVAAGAVGAMLLAAVLLLPSGPAASSPTPTGTRSSAAVRAVPRPTVAATTSTSRVLNALVAVRARCLAAGDSACLTAIEAVDSPVLRADLIALRAGTDPLRVDPGTVRQRSATGGVVFGEAGGITLLAVRQPDGWRLRDIVAATAPGRPSTSASAGDGR